MSEALEVYGENLRESVHARELDAVPELPAALTEVAVGPVQVVLPEEHVQTVL